LARQKLQDGIDPLDAKAAAKAARAIEQAKTITFEAAAREYFAQTEQKWRNVRHSAQFLASLESYVFDKIGNLPVAAIDTGQVLKVLEQYHDRYPGQRLWDAIPETANRVRKRIEAVMDWAAVRGYRAAGDNPARWSGHIEHTLPARSKIQKTVHHAALPYAELPAFFAKLNERDGVTARALEFTILTAARTGETLGATWDEIDFTARMWIVPAGRIKGGRTHRVPLSNAAIAILQALPREDGNNHLFVSTRRGGSLNDRTMAVVLRRMGRADVTTHGFRSSFRDWGAEQTAYPHEMLEMALAHAVGTKTEAAYRRTDMLERRRRLMDDWSAFCTTPARGRDNVRAIRSAR
jgi:integrase